MPQQSLPPPRRLIRLSRDRPLSAVRPLRPHYNPLAPPPSQALLERGRRIQGHAPTGVAATSPASAGVNRTGSDGGDGALELRGVHGASVLASTRCRTMLMPTDELLRHLGTRVLVEVRRAAHTIRIHGGSADSARGSSLALPIVCEALRGLAHEASFALALSPSPSRSRSPSPFHLPLAALALTLALTLTPSPLLPPLTHHSHPSPFTIHPSPLLHPSAFTSAFALTPPLAACSDRPRSRHRSIVPPRRVAAPASAGAASTRLVDLPHASRHLLRRSRQCERRRGRRGVHRLAGGRRRWCTRRRR